MTDHLARARQTADYDAVGGNPSSGSPDARTIPILLAGILDALVAIADRLPDGPALGSRSVCRLCSYRIEWDGTEWRGIGDGQPCCQVGARVPHRPVEDHAGQPAFIADVQTCPKCAASQTPGPSSP